MFLTSLTLSSLLLTSAFQNLPKAYPNNIGGTGGSLRTFSAVPNEPTTFGVQLLGNFFYDTNFINSQKQGRNQFRLDGNYTFNLGIPVEVFGGVGFTYNENSNAQTSTTMTTFFENIDLGLRAGKEIASSSWYLGGYGYVRGLSGTRAPRNTSGALTTRSGPQVSGSVGFISTLDYSEKFPQFPFRQHLNIGYRLPNGDLTGATQDFNRFALDSFKYQAIVGVIALEMIYKYVKPFLEYSMEYAVATGHDSVKFADNRKRITPGVRITPFDAFSILVAGDISMGGPKQNSNVGIPRNPPWDIYIGAAFQTLGRKIGNTIGSLRGLVSDANTGLPLSDVKVSVVGETLFPIDTDLAGFYEFHDLPNGEYQIRFERLGYEPVVKSFSIRNGDNSVLDTSLSIAGPKRGGVQATVIDSETKEPIKHAFVTATGVDSNLSTDDLGQIKIGTIQEGNQSIHIEAPGYLAQDFPVEVLPKQLVMQTLELKKAPPQNGICSGVIKNKDGTPLTAVISSADGKIAPFGTNPVTGEFSQTLPAGVSTLKVQAENYMPQEINCDVKPGERTAMDIVLEKPKEATVVDNKIILPEAIYFEFGSATIKEESLPVLDQVVKILIGRDDFKTLHVEGHTDNVGSDAANEKLSTRRAQAVRTYLVKKGVKRDKVQAAGFGKTKPVSTNTTAEGRAENRRVEFNIERGE